MRFYDADNLSLSTTATTLTTSKIDNISGARAERAFFIATIPVFFTCVTSGALTSSNSLSLDANEVLEITGYDNLKAFRVQAQTGTGNAHVEYET